MADTILRVVIEDDGPDDDTKLERPAPAPTPAASAAAPPPWYDEYRGLRNRADIMAEAGRKLGDADRARLDDLQKRLEDLSAAGGPPAPPPVPPPPPPPQPPPQPTANRGPAGTPTAGDLAAMREFLLAAKELKPLGFTRQTVAGMSEDMVRQLAGQAGYKPPEPTAMKWDAAADAAADAMDRLRKGLLTTEEALDRVAKAARKGGDALTDSLRAAKIARPDQTAGEYYRDKVEAAAEAAGKLPVGERKPLPTAAPAAYPSDPARRERQRREYDAMMDEADRAAAAREAADRADRTRRTRQMAEGVRGMGTARSASGFAGSALQFAESGALGGRAAALAGGPAGAAVVAALAVRDAVESAVKRPFAAAREGMQTAGQMARDAAGGNGADLVARGADAAGNALSRLGPTGVVAGEALKTFGAGVKEATAAVNAFVARGREIAHFDARLARADAMADVRGVMRDLREARQLGGKYADLTNAQSSAEDKLAEVLMPLKAFLIEKLTGLTDAATGMMEFARQVAPDTKVVAELVKMLASKWTLGWSDAIVANLEELAAEAKRARELEERLDRVKADRGIDDMLAAVEKLQIGGGPPNPDQGRLDRQLMLPIFGKFGG